MTIERPMFPPRDSTRRGFLTLAAGGTVAALAITTAAQAAREGITPSQGIEADPIYAVIDRHRAACEAHREAVRVEFDFEEVGMTGEKLRQFHILQIATSAAFDDMDDVGCDLINTPPTTLAGIFALCQYIKPLFAEDDATDLPIYILYDDDRTAYPAEAFAHVIGRAVEEMMKAAAGKAVQS